jgi:hypothetical protein
VCSSDLYDKDVIMISTLFLYFILTYVFLFALIITIVVIKEHNWDLRWHETSLWACLTNGSFFLAVIIMLGFYFGAIKL